MTNIPAVSKSLGVARGLLHIAAAAPHLNTGIRDADHEYMIRSLIWVGCDINGPDKWMLKHINTNQGIDKNISVSPLAQTVMDEDGSEEVRLEIAKILLNLGAKPDSHILCVNAGFSYYLNLLQYCVLYKTAAFVRLLLQHGAAARTGLFSNMDGGSSPNVIHKARCSCHPNPP